MRPNFCAWFCGLLLFATGCSTAPCANFADYFFPGPARPGGPSPFRAGTTAEVPPPQAIPFPSGGEQPPPPLDPPPG